MSGFLLLIVIDRIMKRTVQDNNTGIRWKLWSKPDDLDYADDIALISSTRGKIQQKVRSLNSISKETGLKINTSKAKLLQLNTASNKKIQVDEQDSEDVESFCTLGRKGQQVRWH